MKKFFQSAKEKKMTAQRLINVFGWLINKQLLGQDEINSHPESGPRSNLVRDYDVKLQNTLSSDEFDKRNFLQSK